MAGAAVWKLRINSTHLFELLSVVLSDSST